MNILVLAGGLSPERDVSLVSGSLIALSLIRSGHKVLLLDVYEGIKVDGETKIEDMFSDSLSVDYSIAEDAPDLEEIKRRNGGRRAKIGDGVIEAAMAADVVFLALHGDMGENGQLQATLDNYAIKYTGSGYIGCLLAMDKDITKRMIAREGVPTAMWVCLDKKNIDRERVLRAVGLPCVVKPCSCGSSVGVSIVESEKELDEALSLAKAYENKIVVEKKLSGREFSVGILDGRVLPPIEIVIDEGFYDYKNKYQGKTVEICPAELTEAQLKRVSDLAMRVFDTLSLDGYARIDFILAEDGEFYCLEANSLPGMTPNSLLPQEARAAGIDYDTLCETIAKLGYEK